MGLRRRRAHAPGRPRPHRRALRHLVLGADAARARRGRRACSTTSTRAASCSSTTARRWLRTTDFGDQRDRVLVKSDGSTTYLCNDLAYHRDKFARGWEHLIDIWGADHHGQVKSLQAGHGGARLPGGRARGAARPAGEADAAAASRSGSRSAPATSITLADILDEVDPDVARLTFLLQGIDTTQTFDLDVVTAQSMENPVYYVQYAHARIASIGRQAAEAGIDAPADRSTRRPRAARARARARPAARARGVSRCASRRRPTLRAPHRVTTWVRDFAKRVPRLLPRLPGDLRRRRAHPGAALARRGVPARAGRARSRSSACTRPTRWRGSTTTTTSEPDAVSDAPLDSALLPRTARVDAAGRLSIGGVDLDGARRGVRHAALRLRRGRAARRGAASTATRFGADAVAYAGKAFLCAAMAASSPRRGCTSTSRPAASSTSRCRPGFPPSASCSTATTSPTPSCGCALDAGVGRIVVDSLRRARPARGARRRRRCRAPRVLRAGHARRRGAHARVHRDRHRRLEVRLHGRERRAPRDAASRVGESDAHASSAASTATSARRSSVLDSYATRGDGRRRARGRRRATRPARRSTSSTSAAGSASRYLADDPTRRRSPSSPTCCATAFADACAASGLDPAPALDGRAGPVDRRAGGRHAVPRRHRSRRSPACARTSRSTAA